MLCQTIYGSPLGEITLASDGESLVGLWFTGQRYYGGTVQGEMLPKDDLPVFAAATDWLNRYFAGGRPGIYELPLAPIGGAFRQKVWKLLCEIPYGEVTTYGALAKKIAAMEGKSSMSAQAVGGAVSHNPISIIIPCHRVVGANGSLTGYAGGIERKTVLLTLEGADSASLKNTKKR